MDWERKREKEKPKYMDLHYSAKLNLGVFFWGGDIPGFYLSMSLMAKRKKSKLKLICSNLIQEEILLICLII